MARMDWAWMREGGMVWERYLHDPHQGGVFRFAVASDPDGTPQVASTGGLDGVLVWSHEWESTHEVTMLPDGLGSKLEQPVNVMLQEDTQWAPEAKVTETERDDIGGDTSQEKAILLEIENIRKKLRVLVDQNQHCPDLERLDRSEFCIDHEERDRLATETDGRCAKLRAQVNHENAVRQFKRDRMVNEFWETMDAPGAALVALYSKLAVPNYPRRKVSDAEMALGSQVAHLRQVELLEDKWFSGPDVPSRLKK